MKITIEHYKDKFSVELPEDQELSDLLEKIILMLRLMTYHEKTIKNAILDLADEIKDEI